MSQVHERGAATPEMNMTPLIDVTFQLIIFFMLVTNIVSAQTVKMIVPELEDPQVQELTEGDRVVVNIEPKDYEASERKGNPLDWRREAVAVVIGLDRFLPTEISQISESIKSIKARNPKAMILLRADAALSYEEIAPVMAAIGNAGIEKIEMVAYKPDRGPQAQP